MSFWVYDRLRLSQLVMKHSAFNGKQMKTKVINIKCVPVHFIR
jgi:hypothetical protein